MLFSDVARFTAMSERLDPEEVHGIMDRVFEIILAAVHKHEGTVNQFLGDGVMALFGAPIAHEEHPASPGPRGLSPLVSLVLRLVHPYEILLASRPGPARLELAAIECKLSAAEL